MSKPLALVVDDEPDICELLGMTLERMGVASRMAGDISDARRLLERHSFAICLTDMRLPDGNGLDLVSWIQERQPGLPVAVITAHGNVEAAVDALKRGAFDFVSKPVQLEKLRSLVSFALKLPPNGERNDESAADRLLGNSPAIREVRTLLHRVSRSQAPVHLSGESGTGKELAARLIHASGSRASGPFVPVNCGAIPAELMESEFFGHKKGSFTGAANDKAGLFQTANGGTLFLDEVADLPLPLQVKLLRVIQERSVRPVGSATEAPVDVRILSATHKNLGDLVRQGKFREDLYYRINVIQVHMPSLRERPDDIPLLAERILARLAAENGRTGLSLSADAQRALETHTFPGNVRELENILERAMTLSDSSVLGPEQIMLRQVGNNDIPSGALPDQVDEIERQAIREALEKTRYNRTAAAKLLGLTLRQLRYRIEKLGID